jgi:hypothetical protein
MGGFDWIDIVINIVLLSGLLWCAIWLFRNRDKQPDWDAEERRCARGTLMTYRMFFVMGIACTAISIWDGRLPGIATGSVLAVWGCWRWIRLRRRRLILAPDGKLKAE